MIELEVWRWEDYPGLLVGPDVITRVLIRGRHKDQSQEGDVAMEAEAVLAHFEDGGRD